MVMRLTTTTTTMTTAKMTGTAKATAGGGGDTTTVVAEGSLTKRLGGTPHRCLGGSCAMTVIAATTMAGARSSPIRRKTPENTGKRGKTPENAANIVNWG